MQISQEEIHFRGTFMSLFIDIEWVLTESLSTILVGDTFIKMNFLEFISPNLLLDKKITIIKSILKKKQPLLLETYKETFEDLRKLVNLRNSFAHKRIEINMQSKQLFFLGVDNCRINKSPNTFDDLNEKYEKLKVILVRLNSLHQDIVAI